MELLAVSSVIHFASIARKYLNIIVQEVVYKGLFGFPLLIYVTSNLAETVYSHLKKSVMMET
jgi:hypothetical protein